MSSIELPTIEKHYEILDILFQTMPYLFWKDITGKYQGANMNQALNFGFSSPSEFVGKSIYEILQDQDAAKQIDDIDNEIMRENKTVVCEEVITEHGVTKTYLSQKRPIQGKNGDIIGLFGFAVDVTELKSKEKLAQAEKDKFINVVSQVVHDIRSPLVSLQMLVNHCTGIPESQRVALREATIRITDIANHLFSQYKPRKDTVSIPEDEAQPMLVSTALLQIITEKKYQYQSLPISFEYEFDQAGYFAFINIEPVSFKRMISNTINNAVEAFYGKPGTVRVIIKVTDEFVHVLVSDNGAGMSEDTADKIRSNVAVTVGKEDGQGIGLTQVRETLQRNNGTLSLSSSIGSGTEVVLTFPKISAPQWMAEYIEFNADDTIIILDDDPSVHGAWESRLTVDAPSVKLKHFEQGEDAIKFINEQPPGLRSKIFLMADYELLKQNVSGLDVINLTYVKRSILVTSHYANKKVLELAKETGTKILPKMLASEVPIKIRY